MTQSLLLGIFLLASFQILSVSGQGRFVENLVKLRSSLAPEKFQKLLLKFTAKLFAPHDSRRQGEKWSTVFLAQPNTSREAFYTSKFNESTPINFSHFDFNNANEDGSGIAKIYREDIEILQNMKEMFRKYVIDGEPRLDSPVNPTDVKDPMDVNKEHLELMLTKVLTVTRNHEKDKDSKEPIKKHDVAGYIWAKIGSFGFLTGAQTFKPQQLSNPYGEDTPRGSNMIGILPGKMWGTPDDRILVVGAHWDTVKNTGGLDDNGSGVAAILELARALYHGECENKYSVIIVAFDLEEFGSQGSLVFVQDFLIPRVMEAGGYPHFTGAIIMDSLLHYNTSKDSQDMEPEWGEQVPEATKSILDNRMTGDFLAAFTRATPGDQFLTETFTRSWEENDPNKEIRLENFLMTKLNKEFVNLTTMSEHLNFLRSDHSRFWVANNKKYFASLPAILLTDTGPYRGNMRACYHSPCDTFHTEKPERINWKFYLQTTQSLIDTVAQLSHSKCHSRRKYSNSKKNPGEMFLLTEGMKQEAVAMKQEDKQNHKDKILSDATDTASDGDELINITEAASTVVKDEVHMIDDINLPTNNTSDDTSKIYKDDPSSQNLSEFDNEERFKETKSKDKSDNKFKDEDEDSKLGNKRSLHSIDTVNTTKRPHHKISISPYMFQQNKKKKPHTHNNHSPHRHYPLFLLNSEPPHPQHLIMTKDKIISPYWNLHPSASYPPILAICHPFC